MKKFLSVILSLALLPCTHAFAADDVQSALSSVKKRVQIPAELTEFDSGSYKDGENITYNFNWSDKNNKLSIEVECDAYGRISRYYSWNNSSNAELRLTPYTAEDALNFAEEFLKKSMPEAYENGAELMWDGSSPNGRIYSSGGVRYTFNFKRMYQGAEVYGNDVSVTVLATQNGMKIQNMRSEYDYDAEFSVPKNITDNANDAYIKAFPIKLHYIKDYENSTDDTDAVRLIYSVDDNCEGFISAETGEIKEEKLKNAEYSGGAGSSSAEDASSDNVFLKESFTEAETAELENVKGLISEADAEKILRGISDLKMTSGMKLSQVRIYKEDDGYFINIGFSDDSDSRSLSATLDAKSGEIKSIFNYCYEDYRSSDYKNYAVTDAQKDDAQKKCDSFFKSVSAVAEEYVIDNDYSHSSTVTFDYVRTANGVDYTENSAGISYDVKNSMIKYYFAPNHSAAAEFADPSLAADAHEVYTEILSQYPLKKVYVFTDADKYELCLRPSKSYITADALTGKIENTDEDAGGYTDIDAHWCANAVGRLADAGICLNGTEFKPNENITKADLLRLFSAGLSSRGNLNCTDDVITELMREKSVIADDETADSSFVMREDACVYMVRLAGFERVAKLSDIFTVDFADKAEISADKTGYASILSGMGVICGDGQSMRPKDYLTRAEAAQMLYVYLLP